MYFYFSTQKYLSFLLSTVSFKRSWSIVLLLHGKARKWRYDPENIIIMSVIRRPLMDAGLPHGLPQRAILYRTHSMIPNSFH